MKQSHSFNRFIRSPFLLLAAVWVIGIPAQGQTLFYDVTMDLKAHASTVAVQFDLGGNANLRIAEVNLVGLPDHQAETNFIDSVQRSRVVVYSVTGEPIVAAGRVSLRLSVAADQILTNGMLQVTNVLGSNADGVATTVQPNLLPLIHSIAPGRRTPVAQGQNLTLSARVVDLDGSLQSATFRLDGNFLANIPASGNVTWTASALGTRLLTVRAGDNRSDFSTSSPVDLVVYDPSSITTYNAFRDLHFTAADISAGLGVPTADPFGSGFANLRAFFHDIAPGSPDFLRAPQFELETAQGGQLTGVLTFLRRTTLPSGLTWSVQRSTNLINNTAVPSNQITQEALSGGLTRVTARVPVAQGVTGQFLHLDVQQQ